MQSVLRVLKRHWKLAILFVIAIVIGGVFLSSRNQTPDWITATADSGPVTQITSVSGTLRAIKTAELSFPVTGVVESIRVLEGAIVSEGDELAVLVHDELRAEYEEAQAALRIAEADYAELFAGIREEERDVTETQVAIAEENLARTIREQTENVEGAYRTLITTDLVARPEDKETGNIAPTISGTYMCGEGTYTFTLFRSDTESGFSYKLRGIEEGTFPAYTDTPGYLGACGLTIQFGNSSYDTNNTWTIAIPNTESASYVTNLNAYNQARVARDNAIRAAEQALTLAKENARVNTAPPRSEAQIRATETLRQAAARLEAIRARMSEHTITAPFSGIISRIIPVQGESVGSEPAITMIANDDFELIALIPEIDVTRVTSGQKSRVVFDAMQRETLEASVVRVAPLAREINGVSYFEATLVLTNPPAWLRGGLNADIDIVLDSRDAAVRIPKRFLMWESNAAYVLVPAGTRSERLAVDVLFEGNDGFVEVTGIAPGTTVIAP